MPTSEIYGGQMEQVTDHVMITSFSLIWKVYLESVLRKGAELVKRKGIKCLVIDPLIKLEM